jgi:hypothetical protein
MYGAQAGRGGKTMAAEDEARGLIQERTGAWPSYCSCYRDLSHEYTRDRPLTCNSAFLKKVPRLWLSHQAMTKNMQHSR